MCCLAVMASGIGVGIGASDVGGGWARVMLCWNGVGIGASDVDAMGSVGERSRKSCCAASCTTGLVSSGPE